MLFPYFSLAISKVLSRRIVRRNREEDELEWPGVFLDSEARIFRRRLRLRLPLMGNPRSPGAFHPNQPTVYLDIGLCFE